MRSLFLVILVLYSLLHHAAGSGVPVFHGAQVVGIRPSTPLVHIVAATGQMPITYHTDSLPVGLTLDPATGILSGIVTTVGDYSIPIKASNANGTSSLTIKLVVGKDLCLTPPMGWNSWNVFTNTINEKMLLEIADALVATGMRDMGYEYINIDDFWHGAARSIDGSPTVDSVKFPHGIKYLADYLHSLGLKLGIYSCAGSKTCGKCFGGHGSEVIDAQTYASWGVDLLKYDYCFAPWGRGAAVARYMAISAALRATNRSIALSICEWGLRKPWHWGYQLGGSYWRITPDIFDTWAGGNPWQMSVMKILNKEKGLEKYAGAGHWNDPDMLIVGNHGLGKATSANGKYKGMTQIEYRSHFALWCILAAPLLASCDLRRISAEDLEILTNPTLIAINQDPLGKQATLVSQSHGVWIYEKPLADGSMAIAAINMGSSEQAYTYTAKGLIIGAASAYNDGPTWEIKGREIAIKTLLPHETKVWKITVKGLN